MSTNFLALPRPSNGSAYTRYAASTAPEMALYIKPFLIRSPGVRASIALATKRPGEYLAALTVSSASFQRVSLFC